jgi:hypothetical protein
MTSLNVDDVDDYVVDDRNDPPIVQPGVFLPYVIFLEFLVAKGYTEKEIENFKHVYCGGDGSN